MRVLSAFRRRTLTPALSRSTGRESNVASVTAERYTIARRDRLISATIACTPLMMPFYFDYDQLLLAIPAILFAADLVRRDRLVPLPTADRWLLRIWPIQYAWLMFNPDLASAIHVNLGVPLLAAVAGLLVGRCARPERAVNPTIQHDPIFPEALAA